MTVEKWSSYPEYQQILMIANELNRAKNGIKINDPKRVRPSLERAFNLIDLTVQVTPGRKSRELLRCREKLAEIYVNPLGSESTLKTLIKLFVSFSPQAWNLIHTSL